MPSVPSGPWFPWQQCGGGGPRHGRADGSHQCQLPDQPRDCAQRAAAARLRDQAWVPRQLPRRRLSRPDSTATTREWYQIGASKHGIHGCSIPQNLFLLILAVCQWNQQDSVEFCQVHGFLFAPYLQAYQCCVTVVRFTKYLYVSECVLFWPNKEKSLIFCDVCGEKWPTILIDPITWF